MPASTAPLMSGARRILCMVAAAIAIISAHAACSEDAATSDRTNVVLIIMDTTRADCLGSYGSKLGLTPNLDRFAASGARFENAYSHAPWTLPSVASLLTSTLPAVHGAGGKLGAFHPLSDSAHTVAETFRSNGYETGAIINVLFLSELFGLTRGFDHIDYYENTSNQHMRPAAKTTDAALRWIKSNSANPFFLMVHYFDPHLMYAPPSDFRKRFADPKDRGTTFPKFGTIKDMLKLRRDGSAPPPDAVQRLRKLHNGEIAYVDDQIGRLVHAFDEMNLADRTIFVVVADHGEEFLDHGGFEHGHSHYEELLKIPMIFFGAEIPAGVVANDLVGSINVAPTLCHLADLQIPQGFNGQTLLPAFSGQPLLNRAVLSQGNMWGPAMYSLRKNQYKLIQQDVTSFLFDIRHDPAETNDLSQSKPELVVQMFSDLTLLLEQFVNRNAFTPVNISAAHRAQLCALGYLQCDE